MGKPLDRKTVLHCLLTLLQRRPIPANAIRVKSVAATTLLKITNRIHSYPLQNDYAFDTRKANYFVLMIT